MIKNSSQNLLQAADTVGLEEIVTVDCQKEAWQWVEMEWSVQV